MSHNHTHSPVPALPKLTSLCTQTLSLLLERERLPGAPTLHLVQISQNMRTVREGLAGLMIAHGNPIPAELEALRAQYERMRGMLGEDTAIGAGIESIKLPPPPPPPARSPSPHPSELRLTHTAERKVSPEPVYEPYTDNPYADDPDANEPGILLQTQREMMDAQTNHLSSLSTSISRTHHLSLQINDELDSHVSLLEGLDGDLDRTGGQLGRARRMLGKVESRVKGNGSTVTIALLILVLLVLIVVFKT
ncbi:syntaxin-like protein [Hygrophoropsis aurantiaca]|uniref:Syntaxin-like protein n=1 Tax=Hygrophoropsis aurantiaca TaxID=72124 RepID=A0ACB8AIB3_9AGAM|nr:syntaxin-like protein [Hygrophoropsis aurantiaca]